MESKSKKRYGMKKKYTTSKRYTLGCGKRGFLCSCNGHERECIRECYNILNKYAEKLYPSVPPEANVDNNSEQLPSKPSEDMEVQLQEEIAMLKSEKNIIDLKRFQVVDSSAKNFLFIQTTVADPVTLATTIMKDMVETKQLQSRYLIRLIPIEITCKAYVSNITKACATLLEKHFKEGAKTFSIAYNHRNNNSLSRDVIITEIARLVSEFNPKHVVDLNSAQITIVIEIIKSVALIAVIPEYLKYKRFNLNLLSHV